MGFCIIMYGSGVVGGGCLVVLWSDAEYLGKCWVGRLTCSAAKKEWRW